MTAKRLAAALAAFLLLAPSAWAADAVIPALTAAGAVAGADLLPTSQSGGAATKQTMTAIAVYTNGVLVGASNTFTGADNFTAKGAFDYWRKKKVGIESFVRIFGIRFLIERNSVSVKVSDPYRCSYF